MLKDKHKFILPLEVRSGLICARKEIPVLPECNIIIIHVLLCGVLRPRQHSIDYMGDGFHRSKDPTNSIKVLKEMLQRTNQTLTKTPKYTYAQTIIETKWIYTK